jgi:quinoprotein dehydrogenase-associated probable ABC transporter substrate-binding protein
LRVCADPNNLPYSNSRQPGFENEIAALVARDLGQSLAYEWRPQRRGFTRTTLNAARCDVVMGVPSGYELVQTTRPYYTSAFVFVSPHARGLHLRSFDDPRLAHLVVGIQITGGDYNNPPPARALAARRLVANVRGFPVYGDYSSAAPQQTIIDAVADGRVDAAVVWGPLAGYFAQRSKVPLDLEPVTPAIDRFALPFAFDMSMGVRKGDSALRARLDDVIVRRQREIDGILRRFGVPLVARVGGRTS